MYSVHYIWHFFNHIFGAQGLVPVQTTYWCRTLVLMSYDETNAGIRSAIKLTWIKWCGNTTMHSERVVGFILLQTITQWICRLVMKFLC